MQGLLLLNKPKGITSFKAVAAIKKLTHQKRVGHTGTLDPLASGVLPIFIGRPCVLANYVDGFKTYKADILFGIKTDTLDITGEITNKDTKDFKITKEQLNNVLLTFLGKTMQVPPMYSAKKVNGERLYNIARSGKTILREPCLIEIKSIKLLEFKQNTAKIEVCCSKGTYIRSLINDIAEKLNTYATMTDLVRTNSAGFSINNTVELSELTEDNIKNYIITEEKAVEKYKQLLVTQKQAIRFFNGGELSILRVNNNNIFLNDILRIKYNDIFVGLGMVCKDFIKPICPINNPANKI